MRLEKVGDAVRYLMKPINYIFTVQFHIGKKPYDILFCEVLYMLHAVESTL